MLELLFLLLPVAAGYGWYMGSRGFKNNQQQNENRLSRNYVNGLDFLLSNQKDKAFDLFLEMLKKEGSAFEAHLTLGNLFRSRGETDRAIRIHQSLMESASLTFDQRLLAIQQLGRDYMAAGLYDRAERMFNELIEEKNFRVSSLQQLLAIYQAMSEWVNAIKVAQKLIKSGKEHQHLQKKVAHFYCELALKAIAIDDISNAISLLKNAISVNKHCARASIMLGRLYIDSNDFSKTVAVLQKVLDQDKEVISEALLMLDKCYKNLPKSTSDWMIFLNRCVNEGAGVVAELMMSDLIEQKEGLEAAQIYVNRQLQRHPNIHLFHRLMHYHLLDAEEGGAKESLLLLMNIVAEQIRTKPSYHCRQCGFTSHSFYWRCPSCRSWDSVKSIKGFDGQ